MPKQTFLSLPDEKREKIMRAGIHQFIRYGYEKGNVGEIAKAAGVAKGSMYQYFEDKKELFLYSVQWTMELLLKKYAPMMIAQEEGSIFDFLEKNARDILFQMKEERELVIFIQDVFLGKYHTLTDESMEYVIKMSEEHMQRMITVGKKNGSIRNDISDPILKLYITGVSFKIKEYLMSKARSEGEDIIDEDYGKIEKEVAEMMELLKNGMGGK